MVELLATITIIAVLAAVATPSFIAMIRDRRVVRACVYLADYYREARTRALARGNSVAVRWIADGNGLGTIEVRETLLLTAGTGITRTCQSADWSIPSNDTRPVDVTVPNPIRMDFAQGGSFSLASIQLVSEAGLPAAQGEVCFSPDGRTYVRYAANGAWVPLTSIPRYEVTNKITGFKRKVFISPNGVARLEL